MALREGDALGYLRLKQTLQESDTNAVITTGQGGYELIPVLFRKVNGKQELYVDVDDQLINPRSLSGFVRLERMPEEIAFEQAAATTTPEKPVAANWLESRQIAEAEAKKNLAARQAAHHESNGIGINSNKWQTFSDVAYRARNSK
jgi:hypothetical protein